jgi:tetratricopeptide (TPR) repeat protein
MSWLDKLIGSRSDPPGPSPDFYEEGTALLLEQKYHEALTSFRLALRESPNDTDVLLQIAVVYTRIGMIDEARRTYRRVLEMKPDASGAHYGLGFLLLDTGETAEAIAHLRAFLDRPPTAPSAERHVAHARAKLAELTGESETNKEPTDNSPQDANWSRESTPLAFLVDLDQVPPEIVAELLAAMDELHRANGGGGLKVGNSCTGSEALVGVFA